MDDEEQKTRTNREKKVEGRARRRRFVQGTRSYLHAMTNSAAKRSNAGRSVADREERDQQ
jgi:hypothetical protein